MQWSEEGLIIGVRRHGETSVILEIMTSIRGRHLGLVRGGRSSKQRATLQAGNSVQITWRARLEDHLGQFSAELVKSRAAAIIGERNKLNVAQLVFSHLRLLAERDPHPRLLKFVLEILDDGGDIFHQSQMLALLELALLEELGFGLDLNSCAISGKTSGLTHVSPKTGRAVTKEAAGNYVDRLFKLPLFFQRDQSASSAQVLEALQLTGHFLHRHIWGVREISPPMQREQIIAQLEGNLGQEQL